MKKILLTLLGVIVVLGLFAATGYAGYRIGYAQGAQGVGQTTDGQMPGLRSFDRMGPDRLPLQNWGDRLDRNFDRGFRPGDFLMRGFGIFALLRFIGPLFILALLALFIYWLFARSGWQLTRTVQTTQTPPAKTAVKEMNPED